MWEHSPTASHVKYNFGRQSPPNIIALLLVSVEHCWKQNLSLGNCAGREPLCCSCSCSGWWFETPFLTFACLHHACFILCLQAPVVSAGVQHCSDAQAQAVRVIATCCHVVLTSGTKACFWQEETDSSIRLTC